MIEKCSFGSLFFSPKCRGLLRWWTKSNRTNSIVYLSDLWKNGLHRESSIRSLGTGAFGHVHRSLMSDLLFNAKRWTFWYVHHFRILKRSLIHSLSFKGLTIEDFTSHLSIEHNRSGRGYDTPQALRGRRVPHSNHRTGGINQTRNRRQMTPNTVTMLSNINPLLSSLPHDQVAGSNSQIRDLDPITELLSQLRRHQNTNQSTLSSNSFTNANSNPLHLHLDRNNFRGSALRQVFDRSSADIVVRRHNQASLNQQTIAQSNLNSNGAGLSYLLMDTSTNQLNSTSGQTVSNSNNLTNQG